MFKMTGCRGRNFDVIDVESGDTVLKVRHLWPQEPIPCCMCGMATYSNLAVPYYCGPTREGASEGGYKTACYLCHMKWERWNTVRELLRPFPAATWRPSHGGYQKVASTATT